MKNKYFLLTAFLVWGVAMSSIDVMPDLDNDGVRSIININAGWQYVENNLTNIKALDSENNWENVDLPHTWNQWDAVDNSPGYRRDASWYKKEIFIQKQSNNQYILYFEGVNISSTIYVNGVQAGSHIGGYVGFDIDITDHVQKGEENTIVVRVDNSYNPNVIPSQKADFFIYGGITRDVWLKILPEINFQKILISTPEVSHKKASTSLKILFHNDALLKEDYKVSCQIIEPESGRVVGEKMVSARLLLDSKMLALPDIINPKLWSPDHPNLYQVKTQLLDGNHILDEKVEIIGYRWFRFEEYGAFFLNGERLLLRGTHRHEEHAGYGAAMPNELHRKDIQQIKEMGANFLRLGHYPQDPVVYETCDKLGILVWDELPWCRGGMGAEKWQANTERLLTEQIQQNYNHPSIFFWSLGNEIFWLPDFEDGDNELRLNKYVTKLNNLVHNLDNNRLTAIRKYYAGADLVDVFSPSIWSGWYAGVYTNYKKTLTENQKKYPRFLHMEYGGSSHVGRHTETPITGEGSMSDDDWAEVANQVNIKNIAKSGDWTENYIVDLFDWYLSITETQDNLSGNAQWAFKDFGTPLRPENAIPYLNQKGLVDRAGNPKDAYYVFKSYWAQDPFTYIESHSWTERRGPRDKPRNISIFSNCEWVELYQQGKSLGKKQRVLGEFPASGLNWDVKFSEGANRLVAYGYKEGEQVAIDSMVVNYRYEQADKADHIDLSYKVLENGNYLIEAVMLDKKGQKVLDYEKHLYFAKDGKGKLLKDYGTPTRSQVIEMANGYAAIELKPEKKGKAIIEARNQDFKGSYLVIDFEKDKHSLQE
jgi:beta-galactosidase